MKKLELYATLWPSFPHFLRFARDDQLSGIRLNSAMMDNPELEKELGIIETIGEVSPLFFDVKGRQLRVEKVNFNKKYLDLTLNHAIEVDTPTPVIFKAGADSALLLRVEEGGKRLIFRGGPEYLVRAGESLHIRHPSLKVLGPVFTEKEKSKIEKVKAAGFKKYFLSYVEKQSDIEEFLELVGQDAEVWLKIENRQGLEFVATSFKKAPNLVLVAARGDMYVEIEKPHMIPAALRLVIEKDPEACVGSRILLSVVNSPVPSCADFLELAWLYDVGYRRMMLCDELCLKGDLLGVAVSAFEAFRGSYEK